jgi:hypothetical protein
MLSNAVAEWEVKRYEIIDDEMLDSKWRHDANEQVQGGPT